MLTISVFGSFGHRHSIRLPCRAFWYCLSLPDKQWQWPMACCPISPGMLGAGRLSSGVSACSKCRGTTEARDSACVASAKNLVIVSRDRASVVGWWSCFWRSWETAPEAKPWEPGLVRTGLTKHGLVPGCCSGKWPSDPPACGTRCWQIMVEKK